MIGNKAMAAVVTHCNPTIPWINKGGTFGPAHNPNQKEGMKSTILIILFIKWKVSRSRIYWRSAASHG